MQKFYADFETQSEIDLPLVGTTRYAKHRSTDIQCLGYLFNENGYDEAGVFTAEEIKSKDSYARRVLMDMATNPDVVFVCHNAFFDRHIWNYVMTRYGYPEIPIERWRCTQVKAYKYGLPGGLAKAAKALELPTQKNLVGQKNMLMLAKPMKTPIKRPDGTVQIFHQPDTHKELFELHYSYCLDDVFAMVDMDRLLPDLSKKRQRVWEMDQRLNSRGVKVDINLIEKALNIIQEHKDEQTFRYQALTDSANKPTQRSKLKKWLEDQDIIVPNTKKSTLKPMLGTGRMINAVQDAVEIFLASNKSSLAKYVKMEQLCDAMGIITELIQFHAAHTGRWGGRGIQPQNFPRPTFKDIDTILLCLDICNYEGFKIIFGERTTEAIATALRAMIVARDGCTFHIGDYKQIEARITAWVAGQLWKLKMFEDGVDTYCKAAEPVFGRVITPDMKEERQVGKCCELGLGFGGGIAATVNTAKAYGVSLAALPGIILPTATARELDTAKFCYEFYEKTNSEECVSYEIGLACDIIKQRWRLANPEIVEYWDDLERAACDAIEFENSRVQCGKVTWYMSGAFLICELPSKNFISYFKPEVHRDKKGGKYFSFEPSDPKIYRKYSYGGFIMENVVQAIAADIMQDAMVNLEDAGFTPALTVHDEAVTEDRIDDPNLNEKRFASIMLIRKSWMDGLPIDVDVTTGVRYGK